MLNDGTELQYRNTKFLCYGHLCELQLPDDEIEEIRQKGIRPRLKRLWRHIYTVNAISDLTRRYLRSQTSVEKEIHRHMSTNYFIIHPLSRLHFWWQSLYTLLIIMGSIANPLDRYLLLPFDGRMYLLIVICNIADVVDMTDVILNFMIGYRDKKIGFVLNPIKIAFHYLKGSFFLRIICAMPYFAIFQLYSNIINVQFREMWYTPTHNWFDGFNALQYFRIIIALKYFRQMSEVLSLHTICRTLFETIVLTVVTMHWLACMIIRTYPGDKSSFAAQKVLFVKTPSQRYCFCIYRVIVYSTGFDNIPVESTIHSIYYEDWFTVLTMILGRLLILTAMGQIIQLLQGIGKTSLKYQTMVTQLEYYMSFKKLPQNIRKKMRRYYLYRYNKTYFREQYIFNWTSEELRHDLILNNCRLMLESVVLFRAMPYALLQQVVARLQNEMFTVNEVIIRTNAPGECMYFIVSGTVAAYSPLGREVCHMYDGEFFGEVGQDVRYNASIVAVESCELYRLDRQDFEETISPFPDLLATVERQALERLDAITMADVRIHKRTTPQ